LGVGVGGLGLGVWGWGLGVEGSTAYEWRGFLGSCHLAATGAFAEIVHLNDSSTNIVHCYIFQLPGYLGENNTRLALF